jgi:hypothetical protein
MMDDVQHSSTESQSTNVVDCEKGDHAVQPNDMEGTNISAIESHRTDDDEISTTRNEEEYSGEKVDPTDDDDPFALFPALSLTMSSTQAPFMRRNTNASLGRPLTREETMQTLKSVRSRFTEVRSEFDEHVPPRVI